MLPNQSAKLLRVGVKSLAPSSLRLSTRVIVPKQGESFLTRTIANGFNSSGRSFSTVENKQDRRYYWIEPEAEALIAKAYARHRALADTGNSFPPSLSVKDLEAVGKAVHFEPKTFGDKVALKLVKYGEKLMSLFFRKKYDHHAVTLETIAAVPGIVGAAHRHLRSLRNMKRDHGWINPLQEEAENERMHLLIWMQHTKPSRIERTFVLCAQGLYVAAYSVLMFVSPKTAHRTVGYLEEAAHHAYTEYLDAIDSGAIPNVPAGKIAKEYYRLPDNATLRDVVLHVRADECMHRDFNHHLGDLYANAEHDEHPTKMGAM
mmetsp:Transcript_10140/g.12195  ORF Transcript_10140/g.12195 Transcript_10140/m.12195 type:complete len:318 (+) Transcript_10140:569-1522(+)